MYKIVFSIFFFYMSLFSCAGYWEEDYKFVFLEKRDFPYMNIAENLEYSSVYNELLYNYNKKAKEENLKEWEKQLNYKYTKTQLEDFLYKKKNLEKIEDKEFLEYIKFVKKQEIYVDFIYTYYSKKDKAKAIEPQVLIDEALKNISTIKSNYLKIRYFYLALRLAHYKNINSLEVYYAYRYLLEPFKDSIINDWVQGLYAGALVKRAQVVKGVYEFSKLFDNSKINWHLAFYNFKYIKTDKQWQELLLFAKNSEEKIRFYTLRALNKNANIPLELENIASIDINSKYFDMLLYRYLLKSQIFFDDYVKRVDKKLEYKNFINYLESVNKEDKYMVNLTLAYLYFYGQDFKKSKEYISKLKEKNQNAIEPLNLEYVIYLDELKTINNKVEKEIYTKLSPLLEKQCTKKAIHDYTFTKLESLYKNNNQNFKAYLSSQINYLDINSLDLQKYKKLEEFLNSKQNNSLEKYMVKALEKQRLENSLEEVKVKTYVNNFMFKEALETKSKALEEVINFDIFQAFIKGNNRIAKANYTLKEALEKLLKIQYLLKLEPNSFELNYDYATAIYNLSYFGNAASLTTVYKSNYYYKDKNLEEKRINTSIKYYKKALESSQNKEEKAKVIYMLAKSELALYDLKNSKTENYYLSKYTPTYSFSRVYSFNDDESYKLYITQGYGEFFDKIKEQYSNTNYYKELIVECSNLNFYENIKKDMLSGEILKNLPKDKLKALKYIENEIKTKKRRDLYRYDIIYFWTLVEYIPFSNKNITLYNNIAYYLQKIYKNTEAIFLLEKIIEKYPNRIVAYYNLADAYWGNYNTKEAKKAYKKYIELMIKENKEDKIPNIVKERVKW
ncbi:hypothetical protein CP985_04630 [Malaciobacter mytili LMG 24559]|uniref:Tetratricopeptide repeat protein n=1 Tax=Malaciobacter mytili LMG 24559 TaxID=1032238 RepID=A0AAX2AKN0_9BACT|nr:hypothetical protein [Malaciobacter mytili]AXH15675.1 hypothetical protein AMYT_2126 [Malaciobacter mytili LMG 24559]RXK16141.1 hypothetical protein CP985_04630 [Malaciobacter mytili LMG 24559]